MTDITPEAARAQAREAVREARNHVDHFPITDGDAARVTRLADIIETLLAATPEPPTTDEHLAMMDLAKRRWGGAQTRLAFEDGWTLSTDFRRPSPPTEELSDAALADLYWRAGGDDWAIPESLMIGFGRAVEAAARVGGGA